MSSYWWAPYRDQVTQKYGPFLIRQKNGPDPLDYTWLKSYLRDPSLGETIEEVQRFAPVREFAKLVFNRRCDRNEHKSNL